MSGGCSTTTSKIFLVALGLIFWGAATGLIFIGAWVFQTYHHYEDLTTARLTLIPAVIVIAVGVFMFIMGFCGCIGACKENKILLAVFFSLLLIVLTAEVVAAALGYVFQKDVEDGVRRGLRDAVDHYNETGSQHNQMDYVQKELQCCGVYNWTDWKDTYFYKQNHSIPLSCCRVRNANCSRGMGTDGKDLWQNGCYDKLFDEFQSNLVYIIAVAIALAVIQILGMISSCILFCRSQEVRYETLGGPSSGLRV